MSDNVIQKIKITQIKSKIGTKPQHRASLRTLGLKKISDSVVREKNASNTGLVRSVRHLVHVEEIS